MAIVNKIDSNVTGLRIAEEASLGILPGTPIWYGYEPNSYTDFGAEITTLARNPINAGRQRKKGVTVDLDATGGFNTDLTSSNLKRVLQGFFFADIREAYSSQYLNSAAVSVAVDGTADDYTAAALGISSGRKAILSNHLLFASGFVNAVNNGLKVVNGSTADTAISVTDTALVTEAAAVTKRIEVVGYRYTVATLNVVASGSYPVLSRASGAFDFTTLGLVPGEMIYIGGDLAANRFVTAANNGWARVRSVAADSITLDKTTGTMVSETGTGLLVDIYFGNVLKNELGTTIKRRTFQIERQLGAQDDAFPSQIQSEYVVGAVANELVINFSTADKVTADLSFVGIDGEQRTGATGVKSGTRPALVSEDAYNTSSDVSRLKMHIESPTDANPAALFAFLTEFTVTINNNASPNKAISRLGAFEVTAGQFNVDGTATAYFSGVTAVQAVRNNSDVSFDGVVAKRNSGISFDLPLVALGDGRLNVEQDSPITLPLTMPAGEHPIYNHTMLMVFFPYLPTVAET